MEAGECAAAGGERLGQGDVSQRPQADQEVPQPDPDLAQLCGAGPPRPQTGQPPHRPQKVLAAAPGTHGKN